MGFREVRYLPTDTITCYTEPMKFEGEPILPPEGSGADRRFDSADLNIEDLGQFLVDTKFEDREALEEVLTGRYAMKQRGNLREVEMGMTRKFKAVTEEMLDKLRAGEVDESDKGEPLSGIDPEVVLHTTIETRDEKKLNLQIFRVYNRNSKYRFEYTLDAE